MRCKRILSVCSIAIGVWLLAYGCDRDEINDFYGVTYISGFVRDSASGGGIDSALIYVDDTARGDVVYSDSLGHFKAYGYSLGDQYKRTFRVFCKKSGYFSRTDSVYSTPQHRTFDSTNFMLTIE